MRRFREEKLGVCGLIIIIIISLVAIVGPMVYHNNAIEMKLELQNIPSKLRLYKIDNDLYVYLHKDYYFITVSESGEILGRIDEEKNDLVKKRKLFLIDGHKVELDYSKKNEHKIFVDNEEIVVHRTMRNKTYLMGTDALGRDLFARILSGARISLLIAVGSTLLNSLIGIFYGGISGYKGGLTDNIMMRIVDVISTIPTTLVVIMLMVVIGPGVKTIIIAMGFSNWCTISRIVRGQVLSIKNQEFVMAAITANASHLRILTKHLLPNISGSIIVCMTMMIPSAIFTESFLSFIGLGVSAPSASWGTLVSDGLLSFRAFPYQIIIPSLAICITILSLNFIGNAIQSIVTRDEGR